MWDADGNRYIDYHLAHGPIILGHCHPKVNARVFEALQNLDLTGIGTTEDEFKLAELICKHVPSAKKVVVCGSGSEATYSAIRLARAFTGRTELIKFQNTYHGWYDAVLMNTSFRPGERPRPGRRDLDSAGMVKEVANKTHIATFNDLGTVERKIRERKGKIAAIIIEPVLNNIGCIMPKIDFLKGLREVADRHNIVLIFDEVITGIRHGLGGYQKICGVTPDLTTLGKSIANGYPLAATCGREDIMNRFKSAGGDVYIGGTYNGHPLSVAAGIATIEELEGGSAYEHMFALGDQMRKGMQEICERLSLRAHATGFGSLFVTYFVDPPVETPTDLLRSDVRADEAFRRKMIERGFLIWPVPVRRAVVCASHTAQDIRNTLDAAKETLEQNARTSS
jgi:glutamate-1-semialdehyde 2,1-aminomutase